MKTIIQDGYKVTPGACSHCGHVDRWRGVPGGVLCTCAYGTGYWHGIQDRQAGRTAEHSQTSYQFPRQSLENEQQEYNCGYHEGWQR